MAKVQRVPRSLLALLGVVGENPPRDIEPTYRGTIEMLDLILADTPRNQVVVSNAAAVTASNADVVVPQGVVWFVLGAQAQTVGNAATVSDVIQLAIGIAGQFYTADVRPWIVGQQLPPAADAANNHFAYFTPEQPFVLQSGDTVRGTIRATDAGAAQLLITTVVFRAIRV